MKQRGQLLHWIVVMTFLVLIIPNVPPSSSEGTGDHPPPAQGDWVITNDTSVRNEALTITANLTIETGASLTLDHVTLMINASDYGDALIRVRDGAELNIINNSVLMQGETGVNYDFYYESGSSGLIQESTIRDCGWDDDYSYQSTWGVLITSNDVTIENSTITNNYVGIVIIGASPVIKNNVIHHNADYGIFATNCSSHFSSNDIYNNSVGVQSYYSEATFSDNVIHNNGEGMWFDSSIVSLSNDQVIDNGPEDCDSGSCSPLDSGIGIYVGHSEITLDHVQVSGNTEGLISYISNLNVHNSTFSDNQGDGIFGSFSDMEWKDNIFSNNSDYGIRWMYDPIEMDSSNSFTQNNGLGRLIQEWQAKVNVTDFYGDPVSYPPVQFTGNGTISNTTGDFQGMAYKSVAEYIIANDGSIVDYNPYTITANKTGSWDDVAYTNSTEVEIRANMEVNITIPLKKPDLRVDNIEFPNTPKVDSKATIKVTVSNIGEALAKNVQVTVYERDAQDIPHTVNITTLSINPNVERELSISWTPENEGETIIEVEIKTSYSEKDKSNNELQTVVNVKEKDTSIYEGPYFFAVIVTFLFLIIIIAFYLKVVKKSKEPE